MPAIAKAITIVMKGRTIADTPLSLLRVAMWIYEISRASAYRLRASSLPKTGILHSCRPRRMIIMTIRTVLQIDKISTGFSEKGLRRVRRDNAATDATAQQAIANPVNAVCHIM